ncbi:MAG: hypothetical protein WCL13_02445 [bacterium]
MADLKSEIAAGEIMPLNEKPLAGNDNLKKALENVANSEKANNLEQARENVIRAIDQMENAVPTPVAVPTAGIMAPTAKMQKQVESILAEDLAEIYLSLEPKKRQEFKIKGEQTAQKINQLLAKTKINIGEIIKLIKEWLSLIPGLNKYFLEQEAKIKADELIKLRK